MEHRAGSMRPYATSVRFFFDLAPGLASITGEGFPFLLLCVASVTGGALSGFATVDRPSTVGTRGSRLNNRPGSADQGLVDKLAQLRADGIGARGQQLGKERHGQVGVLVDPERGARGPAPGDLPGGTDHLARHRVEDDGEAETEADPAERGLGVERAAERLEVLATGQVIAGHVADGARA